MKFMMDTNIFDLLVASDEVAANVRRLAENGQVEIITTHIQEDELNNIPAVEKRNKIAAIPRRVIPTTGFVLNYSRLGMARLGGGTIIDDFRQGNLRHTPDALIAATADGYADILVTQDKTLTSRARTLRLNVDVWDYEQFDRYLTSL